MHDRGAGLLCREGVETVYSDSHMPPVRTPLPPDFRDRPRLQRWWINILVLLHLRTIKRVCCESFRNPEKMVCCKGCATLYDRNSAHWFYRFVARVGKLREIK